MKGQEIIRIFVDDGSLESRRAIAMMREIAKLQRYVERYGTSSKFSESYGPVDIQPRKLAVAGANKPWYRQAKPGNKYGNK